VTYQCLRRGSGESYPRSSSLQSGVPKKLEVEIKLHLRLSKEEFSFRVGCRTHREKSISVLILYWRKDYPKNKGLLKSGEKRDQKSR